MLSKSACDPRVVDPPLLEEASGLVRVRRATVALLPDTLDTATYITCLQQQHTHITSNVCMLAVLQRLGVAYGF